MIYVLEPSPDSGPWGLIKLAFLWPFVTVWMILQAIFLSEDELQKAPQIIDLQGVKNYNGC